MFTTEVFVIIKLLWKCSGEEYNLNFNALNYKFWSFDSIDFLPWSRDYFYITDVGFHVSYNIKVGHIYICMVYTYIDNYNK